MASLIQATQIDHVTNNTINELKNTINNLNNEINTNKENYNIKLLSLRQEYNKIKNLYDLELQKSNQNNNSNNNNLINSNNNKKISSDKIKNLNQALQKIK